MTCRTRKYGEPGDILEIPGVAGCFIELVDVRQVQLGDVALHHYKQEGCESPEEFKNIWNEIHPRRGFHPDDWVWLHEFKVVP